MSGTGYSRLPEDDAEFNKRLKPQVQNVKGKDVYIFGEGDVQTDSITENTELNVLVARSNISYKSTSQKSQKDVYELRQIKLDPGDTLQAISIRFRCPVAQLKRVNGLVNDSEFYGLNSLKIPIKQHELHKQDELECYIKEQEQRAVANGDRKYGGASIIGSETSDEDHDPQENNSYRANASTVELFEAHSDPEDMTSIVLLDQHTLTHKHSRQPSQNERKKFDKFINRKDDIIADIMRSAQERADSLDSITKSMESPEHLARSKPSRCVSFQVSVPCLLISAVLIFIAVPVVYYLLHK